MSNDTIKPYCLGVEMVTVSPLDQLRLDIEKQIAQLEEKVRDICAQNTPTKSSTSAQSATSSAVFTKMLAVLHKSFPEDDIVSIDPGALTIVFGRSENIKFTITSIESTMTFYDLVVETILDRRKYLYINVDQIQKILSTYM